MSIADLRSVFHWFVQHWGWIVTAGGVIVGGVKLFFFLTKEWREYRAWKNAEHERKADQNARSDAAMRAALKEEMYRIHEDAKRAHPSMSFNPSWTDQQLIAHFTQSYPDHLVREVLREFRKETASHGRRF
jgi:hypothetical protein